MAKGLHWSLPPLADEGSSSAHSWQWDLPGRPQVRAHLVSRLLQTASLVPHQLFPCINTSQGTRPSQAVVCSWLPAPQGRTEHFSAHQEIQFYLPALFNLDNSIQKQSQQQQGLDNRSAKWLMLNINKPENANSFRITAMEVLKSVTT